MDYFNNISYYCLLGESLQFFSFILKLSPVYYTTALLLFFPLIHLLCLISPFKENGLQGLFTDQALIIYLSGISRQKDRFFCSNFFLLHPVTLLGILFWHHTQKHKTQFICSSIVLPHFSYYYLPWHIIPTSLKITSLFHYYFNNIFIVVLRCTSALLFSHTCAVFSDIVVGMYI